MSALLGLNAKAYRQTTGTRATWGAINADGMNAGSAAPNLDEITAIKDVSLKISKGKADVSTRGNNGWAAKLGTLKEASIEVKAVWDPADADLIALMKSFLLNTNIACAFLDGDKATSGTQ